MFVNAVEAFENVGLILKGYADAVVGNQNLHPLPGKVGAYANPGRIGFPVADRVVQKIPINLLEPVFIGIREGGVLLPVQFEHGLSSRSTGVQVFDDPLRELVEVHARKFQAPPFALHAGNREQVLQKQEKPLHIAMDGLQRGDCHFRILDGAILQRFDIAVDDGQGRAEFVRNIGHEIPASRFQCPDGGHILKHQQHSLRKLVGIPRHGGDVNVEMPLLDRTRRRGEFKNQRQVLLATVREGRCDRLFDFMSSEDLKHGAPHMGFGSGEELLEGFIDERDPFFPVGDHDAFFHAGEDASQAESTFHHLLVKLAEPLGNFPDVLSRGLVGRGLGVEDWELEVPA